MLLGTNGQIYRTREKVHMSSSTTLIQGTKRALAHSQMRVGDVPGEYPSVCTGPYYRVQKKKKKKSTMHIMTRLKCRGKLGRGGLKGMAGY